MLTRLEEGESYDATTSAMYSKQTFYWSRETKEGDQAGRIPVSKDQTYHVLLLNYNKEEAEEIIFEYGAASRTLVSCTAVLSTLAAAYLF